MAIPSTRDGFRDYCKRAIGFGVIDINVSDAQVEDRIDEGLQYFAQYHYDGVERMYLKYKLQKMISLEVELMKQPLQQIRKMEM